MPPPVNSHFVFWINFIVSAQLLVDAGIRVTNPDTRRTRPCSTDL
jgi:hypothetical protein